MTKMIMIMGKMMLQVVPGQRDDNHAGEDDDHHDVAMCALLRKPSKKKHPFFGLCQNCLELRIYLG